MKKMFALMMVLVSLLCCASGAFADEQNRLEKILAAGEIVFATSPDFAPIEFINPNATGDDQYVGADVDLAKYIASKLGVKLVIKPMDFGALQAAVNQGAVDMVISGFAYTEERAENMLLSTFYNKTDDDDGQGLLVAKGTGANYNKPEDFAGCKIATQNASLQYNLATTYLPSDIEIKLISNLNDAVMMLITGRVDAIGVDANNGALFASNYPDKIEMSNFYYDFSSEGNVLAVPLGETELIEAINAILEEVNELGLYQQWEEAATELALSLGIEVN